MFGDVTPADFITTLSSFFDNPLISSAVIVLFAVFLFLLGLAILKSWYQEAVTRG